MRFSFSLTEPRTNNEAEYEAFIAGLEIAIDVRIRNLQIFGDSQLAVNQVLGVYKITKFKLACYHRRVLELMKQIPVVKLTQVPRGQNAKVDSLAKLAKEMANMGDDWPIMIMVHNRRILEPALLQFP
ncbi:hypothetical protein MA16_Dca028885 [Dendrobium catenatum]|uniref:RNase H type-1 domain-containing protein n=1 Tax=Dendrobium catenatum TaxID=906689 RepID=A0A2I0VCJ0_9ASPA|nr:hypothetical protein MA16_Dca028885 [Dendrobium catenatum]